MKNLGNRASNLYPQEWRILSSHIPDVAPNVIEFRPTYKQAIKIPLEKHQVTKNVCNILDAENNFQVVSPFALLNIEKMDSELFKLNLEELLVEEAKTARMLQNSNHSLNQSVASATSFVQNAYLNTGRGMARVNFTSIGNSKLFKKKSTTIRPIPIQKGIERINFNSDSNNCTILARSVN